MQLVIAEKPSVAQSIAGVLGAAIERKDGYMEGNDYIVSWCVGHLIELAQPESYDEALQKWTYESLPIIPNTWQHEVKSDTKAQYKVLYQLMHDNRVDSVVCATDAGREGELIFRLTITWQAVTSRYSVYGFLRWRKVPSKRDFPISDREVNMTICMNPHCAGRKQTGLSVSTAQGSLRCYMAARH